MSDLIETIAKLRVVPTVLIDDPASAEPLATAMRGGGVPCAEISIRTPAALEAIQIMATMPDMLVGAGSVTNEQELSAAVAAGARFIVTPGLDADLVSSAQKHGIPIIPGAVTPTEVMLAQRIGLRLLKFFPCTVFGGLEALEEMAAPFPEMKFLPTGGLNIESLHAYLALRNVAACGGNWMVKKEWIDSQAWHYVTLACQQTVERIRLQRRQ
ncbi:MAG: bifunctional 4-hydroxy-2-oxoglutarate aldolase/2-dehydro-3-deoxy-phosphogluconate aldolase [Verrucomicrobiaceae bacterium]|nr:bifunctional 4-hydroxy-2-oxoglutarate aldolase/2-dehydro-3-deoxy-phosphogluconate aldolase [Verrucomicrobiaceae bacterium]